MSRALLRTIACHTASLALLVVVGSGSPLLAQTRLFPDVPSIELPGASPRSYGIVGRILDVGRGDSQFGAETEAAVGIGETFPVLALRRGPRPISLGFGVQVYGQFSLSDPRSALISNDWVVGIHTAAELGAWELVAQIYHESSHLGDEYADHFSATRLDWTREVGVLRARYRTGRWSLYAEGSYLLQRKLPLRRPAAAVALDYTGAAWHLGGQPIRPVAGVFLTGDAATAWRIGTFARAGFEFPGVMPSRQLALSLVAHDGLSTQRQFFAEPNRYLGFELRFDL